MTTVPSRAPHRPARTLRAVPDTAGRAARAQQRDLFADSLRAENSKRGKPYSERTIGAYLDAVDSLGRWLTKTDHPDGFDTMTIGQFNTYLADYLKGHTLGGTVTKQGNLRMFLKHIAEEYDTDNLWTHPKRNSYGRQEAHPPILVPDLIAALLKVTSGKSFEDRRDHALIRVLLHGPRRTEVTSMQVEHLDLTSVIRTFAVIGLKGRPSRRNELGDRDVLALKRWLNQRARHRRIRSTTEGPLWIAEKTGAALKGDGIYQMLRRRAVQAGYRREAIRPHLFRHTMAHEALASGMSESEVMAKAGWKDRAMVDRYGASMAEQRALEAFARSGFSDRY
ncbi:site-specific integrase [Kribbella sancticallisti]